MGKTSFLVGPEESSSSTELDLADKGSDRRTSAPYTCRCPSCGCTAVPSQDDHEQEYGTNPADGRGPPQNYDERDKDDLFSDDIAGSEGVEGHVEPRHNTTMMARYLQQDHRDDGIAGLSASDTGRRSPPSYLDYLRYTCAGSSDSLDNEPGSPKDMTLSTHSLSPLSSCTLPSPASDLLHYCGAIFDTGGFVTAPLPLSHESEHCRSYTAERRSSEKGQC